jgi:predicted DsbA family dithiol-disulfide isomerase
MTRSIAVTFDYRCPFAYNGNAAVVAAIRTGATPDVAFTFVPFSLDQVHVEEGETAVWDVAAEARGPGVRALLFGIAVRERHPEQFLDAHLALFAQRHDHGLRFEEQVLRDAVASVGLDPEVVAEEASSTEALEILANEHTEAVDRWDVFGVPTFIEDEEAVFVRFMERGRVDDLQRMLDLLPWARLNEFKRTRVAN